MGGSKGGSTSSSTNSYSSGTSSTQIPDWVSNASQMALAMGQETALKPYEAYTGQLVAPTQDATNAAYRQINEMLGMGSGQYNQDINTYSNLLGQATPLTTSQIQDLTNQLYGGYTQNVTNPVAGLLSQYNTGPATAGQVSNNAMSLMSPYEQAVIAPSMQAGQQQLAQDLQKIGASANQAGAFGGSRQGVMEGVAQAQTSLGESQQIADLLNKGWQSSLTPSTQLALQGGQQGYGATNTLGNLISSGYGAEQQAGTGLANTNLGLGMTSAQQLPSSLAAYQNALTQQTGLLGQEGTAQQQQAQNVLDAAYGQWQEQQYYPYQQLATLLGTVSSIPYSTTTSSSGYNMGSGSSTNTPSWGSQLGSALGTGATVAALFA